MQALSREDHYGVGGEEMFQCNCTQSLVEIAEHYCKINHINHCYAENSVRFTSENMNSGFKGYLLHKTKCYNSLSSL